jgi:hypothetical protein
LSVVIDDTTLAVGERLVVTAAGFAPGERVTATVHSDPVEIGAKDADASGRVRFEWTVPAGMSAGVHTVVLAGANSGSVEARFAVAAAKTLPLTGSQAGPEVGAALALIALGLTGVAYRLRTRRGGTAYPLAG